MSSIIGQSGGSLRDAFGQALVDLADPNTPNFLVIDCDVSGGTGVWRFRDVYPNRLVQAGIAEQAGVCLAAGMALALDVPIFFTTFASFMMRCYEQIAISVCYNNANVKLVASHPGIGTGPDGATAQCLWDLAAMRALPGLPIFSPCDGLEMHECIKSVLSTPGPVYVRTGRSPTPPVLASPVFFEPGKLSLVYPVSDSANDTPFPRTSDLTLIGCGHTVAPCIEAAKRLERENVITVRVANMSSLKPTPIDQLYKLQQTSRAILVMEDHSPFGGLFGAVAEATAPNGLPCPIESVAVQGWGESGKPAALADHFGIGVEGIVSKARELLKAG